VRLVQRRLNPFKVGTVLARPDEVVPFTNAVHEGYAGLNTLEKPFADAIDKTGLTWARNPPRSGYGVPLISVGPTSNFYPDFLIWTADRVICIDTKGPHLVHETARRKLLRIRPAKEGPRLDVQFVSKGKYDDNLEQKHTGGYTCWGMGDDGTIKAVTFEDMDAVVEHLVDDGLHPA
jgi:type III restriction enzyme